MPADLSKSVLESIQKGLERARRLVDDGENLAASEAYRRCASLADRYASYAIIAGEKARRSEMARQYRQLAESLSRGAHGPLPVVERVHAEGSDECWTAAAAMVERSSVSWGDIGGLDDIKRQLQMAYALALAARPRDVQLTTARNILLYGPPGTGKTLLAAAASHDLEATFFNVRTASILSKYFGESSQLIGALFETARENAPSVVFFDEFDAISGERSRQGSGGAEQRMLATLLSEMDGMGTKGFEGLILVVAATNLPWAIDAAVLSRFDTRVFVPLPDADARRAILELNVTGRGHEFEGDLGEVVALTEGMSGRRIAQLCDAAVRHAIDEMNPDLPRRVMDGRTAVKQYDLQFRPLRPADFAGGLLGSAPVDASAEHEKYLRWQSEHG